MTTAPDLVAQIQRLYMLSEKWRVGTIARQLHVHRDTSCAALSLAQSWASLCTRRLCAPAGSMRTGPSSSRRWPSTPRSPQRGCTPWSASAASWAATSHFRAPHRRAAPEPASRGLPAPAHAARRAGAGGLGPLRPSAGRPRPANADGLRHGAQPQPHDLPALLPRCAHGQLPARPCRGLRRLQRLPPGRPVRQLEERGARAPGRCDPLQPRTAGAGGPLPLRATPGGSRPRQREGPGRARHPVHPRQLLRRANLHRPARPQRAGPCLGHRPGRRPALARGRRLERAPGLRGRGPQPDGAARDCVRTRRARGREGGQDALRALRH
jgi:hypothetical protein